MNVPVHGRIWGTAEHSNLYQVVDSDWYTAGKWCSRFENRLAKYLGVKHVSLCNSGSSANLLAVLALDLKPGDEVITTAVNFPTTVNPILQVGAIPVFIDVTLPHMTADVSQLEEVLSAKTKAVILAHTLGYPFEVTRVVDFCKRNKLYLIEDCCDALGGKYGAKYLGTYADIYTLSFFPAHQIATGEGGAVGTNDERLSKSIRSFRDWGRDCWCLPGHDNTCGRRFDADYDHKYVYSRIGYHLAATEFTGAVGVAQMDRLDEFVLRRQENHAYLLEMAHELGLGEYFQLPYKENHCSPSWFGFAMMCRGDFRNDLCRWLDSVGVGNRPVFGGNLLRQPAYKGITYRRAERLLNSHLVHDYAFWIGCWPGLNNDQLEYAIEMIVQYVRRQDG